jgi:isoquinoline 1-oxidoreductase beta subunit
VLRCPVFGGRLKGFDARKAKAVPGVRRVFEIPAGVAVVAEGFWAAKLARDALDVEWEEGENASLGSAGISARFRQVLSEGGAVARRVGEADSALETGVCRLQAEYQVPYLAHACMEPMLLHRPCTQGRL